MKIATVLSDALDGGFDNVTELRISTLKFMPEIREMCSADRCHNYNKCWSCPPACGSLEEYAEKASGYAKGVIVQSAAQLEDSFDVEGMEALSARHKENLGELASVLRRRDPDILVLGAGACTICPKCTYPDAPCRFPDRMFVSMEASGLWVSDVCKKNNIPYNYGPDTLVYTSCILFD